MPIITLHEDSRVKSFLRRKMYAEALAYAIETEARLFPIHESMTNDDITLLVRILLLKSAALVYLKQHRNSRFAARATYQIVGLYQTRTPEFTNTYDALAECLKDLEELASIGGIGQGDQAGPAHHSLDLVTAMELQHHSEADLVDTAMTLITRLGDLAPE